MQQEHKPLVMPRKSRFDIGLDRNKLLFYLDNLGMRDVRTGLAFVNPTQLDFLISCIKYDLGIPMNVPLWVHWFDTGSVFSEATDEDDNMAFNIELGRKRIPMMVTFSIARKQFPGLYLDEEFVTFQNIKHLL